MFYVFKAISLMCYETSHPDPEFTNAVRACMLSYAAQPTADPGQLVVYTS